jgi:hypothetical protein
MPVMSTVSCTHVAVDERHHFLSLMHIHLLQSSEIVKPADRSISRVALAAVSCQCTDQPTAQSLGIGRPQPHYVAYGNSSAVEYFFLHRAAPTADACDDRDRPSGADK